eukprot:gene9134-18323_t
MAQEDDAKDDPEEEHNEARNVVEDAEEEYAEAAIAMSSAEEEAFIMAEDGDEEVAAENESVAVKPAAETKVAALLVVGNEATGIPTSFKSSAGERSRRAIATHVSARAAAEQQSLGRASRRHARVQPGAQEPAAMLTELEGTPPPSPPPPPPPPSVAVVAPTTVGDGTIAATPPTDEGFARTTALVGSAQLQGAVEMP